ncbi:MAG: hypothetical protein ACRDHL_14170, partial [Candidatus Promineifilaceae bacterium]
MWLIKAGCGRQPERPSRAAPGRLPKAAAWLIMAAGFTRSRFYPMPGRTAAHAILKALPDHVWGSAIICPLCGTAAPSSGLRATSDDEGVDSPWQLIFACPACGLLTNFDVEQVTPQRLEALHGSPWGRKLRAYRQRGSAAALRRPQARGAHFAAAFGLSLLT